MDETLAAAPGSAAPGLRRVLAFRDLVVVAAASMGPAFSLATTLAAMIAAAGRWTWLALTIVSVLMAMVAAGYQRFTLGVLLARDTNEPGGSVRGRGVVLARNGVGW